MVRQVPIMVVSIADPRQMPTQDEYRNSVAQPQLSTLRIYYQEAHTSHITTPSQVPLSGKHLPDSFLELYQSYMSGPESVVDNCSHAQLNLVFGIAALSSGVSTFAE
jgi:hypothetical protein